MNTSQTYTRSPCSLYERMTHYIPNTEIASVRKVTLYIFLAGLLGVAIALLGTMINSVYPDMTSDMRILVALVLVFTIVGVPLIAYRA